MNFKKLCRLTITFSAVFFWVCAGILYIKNLDIAEQNKIKEAEILKLEQSIQAEKAKRAEAIKQALPRYIREGWKEISKARITFYSWDEPLELRWKSRTALNKSAKNNFGCAVDPRLIPYGSEVYIPSIGDYRICDDTGGAIKKDGRKGIIHIDIRCRNRNEVKKMRKTPEWQKIYMKVKGK